MRILHLTMLVRRRVCKAKNSLIQSLPGGEGGLLASWLIHWPRCSGLHGPCHGSLIQRPNVARDLREVVGSPGRNVSQPDHILANPIVRHQAERRPRSSEVWLSVTQYDGVQIDSILVDQAKLGETSREVRTSHLYLPVVLGL